MAALDFGPNLLYHFPLNKPRFVRSIHKEVIVEKFLRAFFRLIGVEYPFKQRATRDWYYRPPRDPRTPRHKLP